MLRELTYKINGEIFEVNRVLGAGFLEKVYENDLLKEFDLRGIDARAQIPVDVLYKEEVVGKIVLELKAIERLHEIHTAQLLNYLKATEYKIGLLVNFTYPKAEIKRYVM